MIDYEEETALHWMVLVGFIFIIVIFTGLYIIGWLRPSSLPEPPGYPTAKQVKNTVELSWQVSKSPSVIGYNIYRSNSPDSLGTRLNSEPFKGTKYIDSSLSVEGDYYYIIRSVDAQGNEDDNFNSIHVYFDLTPPIITRFTIENDKKFTNNPHVLITLISPDAEECRFKSRYDAEWSRWETYYPKRSYDLNSSTDGLRIIYAQCKDKYDNVNTPMSYSIYLDRVSPRLSIGQPIEGATYSTGLIKLVFSVMDDYSQNISCSVILDGNTTMESFIEINGLEESYYETELKIESSGEHELILRCYDQAGNLGVSRIDLKTASLRESIGQFYSISINDDERKTYERDVILYIEPSEGITITRCRFKNENETWSDYYEYRPLIDWTLSDGYGKKKVYSECYDNETFLGMEWDEIIFDELPEEEEEYFGPPIGLSLSINDGSEYTNDYIVTLNIGARYADECRVAEKYDGIPPIISLWEPYTTEREWHLYEGEGVHSLKLRCRNRYGESSSVATAMIIADLTPPHSPEDLEASRYHDGWIRLTWNPSSDDEPSEISYYNIYRQIVGMPSERKNTHESSYIYHAWRLIDSTNSTEYFDTETAAGVTYEYVVSAVDLAGNEGAMSHPVTIEPDFNGPIVEINEPEDGDRVEKRFDVVFSVRDDFSDTFHCEYYLDEDKKGEDDGVSEGEYETTIRAPLLVSDHTYSVRVVCYDEAENQGEAQIRITVEGFGGGGDGTGGDIEPGPISPEY